MRIQSIKSGFKKYNQQLSKVVSEHNANKNNKKIEKFRSQVALINSVEELENIKKKILDSNKLSRFESYAKNARLKNFDGIDYLMYAGLSGLFAIIGAVVGWIYYRAMHSNEYNDALVNSQEIQGLMQATGADSFDKLEFIMKLLKENISEGMMGFSSQEIVNMIYVYDNTRSQFHDAVSAAALHTGLEFGAAVLGLGLLATFVFPNTHDFVVKNCRSHIAIKEENNKEKLEIIEDRIKIMQSDNAQVKTKQKDVERIGKYEFEF